jgi:hypothetical protein
MRLPLQLHHGIILFNLNAYNFDVMLKPVPANFSYCGLLQKITLNLKSRNVQPSVEIKKSRWQPSWLRSGSASWAGEAQCFHIGSGAEDGGSTYL